ncbi:DJ-1/PfpI family protein [bacterium]|nr:DJ-1/PfpI family protein [bacterium]
MHTVLLVIASQGYQPIEYSVPKGILQHSGIAVLTASNTDNKIATASDGTTTTVDKELKNVTPEDFDAIFFIGGPGALQHLDNATSYNLLKKTADANKPFGAICASVRILAKSGVITNKKVTGWNGDNKLTAILEKAGALFIRKPVVIDNTIVTAIGPESAQEFGAKILSILSK